MADNKRDVAAARHLLKKYGNVAPPETCDFLESIAADPQPKNGRPPEWGDQQRIFIYELVEIAKKRGFSTPKAWDMVGAYFMADSTTPYSGDQIKHAFVKGRALAAEVMVRLGRSEAWGHTTTHSGFEAFLDKLEAEPARPKVGAKTRRI